MELKDYTTKELRAELDRRSLELAKEKFQTQLIFDFAGHEYTAKDITVICSLDDYAYNNEELTYYYTFCIDIGGQSRPFYYGNHGLDKYDLMRFIPDYFFEQSEDAYGFDGTPEQAKKLLEDYGITKFIYE